MVLKNITFGPKRTPITNLDLQSNDDKLRNTLIFILGFLIIFYICFLLEWPFNTFLSRYFPISTRSEYTLGEQLSKFYLFIIMLVSIFSYRVLNKPTKIKLSISFLFLSLSMYMSESNMIPGKTRPIFGLIGIAFAGFFLLRLRYWLSLILFITGFTLIFSGSFTDLIYENESINSLLPAFILGFFPYALEEQFDVLGIAFLCLSVLLCFRVPLQRFIAKNTIGSLLILLSSGMMTIGNGFLHYQYRPSNQLYVAALIMTIVGFLGFVFANKIINKTYPSFTLATEDFFYLFIFAFFVVLPSIHGRTRHWTALLLWLPSLILMAIYLWRCHSVHYKSVNENETE